MSCTCIANLDQTVLAAQAEKSGDWRQLPPVCERGDLASLSSENRRRMKANFASSQPVLSSEEHHSRQYHCTQSPGATDARDAISCTGATEKALFTIYFQFNFSGIRCKSLWRSLKNGLESWKHCAHKVLSPTKNRQFERTDHGIDPLARHAVAVALVVNQACGGDAHRVLDVSVKGTGQRHQPRAFVMPDIGNGQLRPFGMAHLFPRRAAGALESRIEFGQAVPASLAGFALWSLIRPVGIR